MGNSKRGDGTTTNQMRLAKPGAVFVWPLQSSLWYARDLAKSLGRNDLKIVSARWFDDDWHRDFHKPDLHIVLDHATEMMMTTEQWCTYNVLIHAIIKRNRESA